MTTSRIVRGTKVRIFLYICAVVVIIGLLACYNSTLSQLQDARKSIEICHQQQENLSTQLQVISDYKQRLEQSLKTEKAEHQQSKNNLENKINEEKSKSQRSAIETKLRFNSLQQHYNLLQTEHDDYKEKSSVIQKQQLNEINEMQATLKEVKEEIKNLLKTKENLKSENLQLRVDNEDLSKKVRGNQFEAVGNESQRLHLLKENNEMRRKLDTMKEKCPIFETIQTSEVVRNNSVPIDKPERDSNVVIRPPEQEQQEQQVLQLPNNVDFVSKSSTTSSSKGSLNVAKPLAIPTVTPKTSKQKDSIMPVPFKKLPDGVVPVPEQSADIVDNRYNNQIADIKNKKPEDGDKENGAHEEFDAQNVGFDGLYLGDPIKHAEKQNFNKQHIDSLGDNNQKNKVEVQAGGDYKENNPNDQNEENEIDEGEDDDQDEYEDHFAHPKDPVVRN